MPKRPTDKILRMLHGAPDNSTSFDELLAIMQAAWKAVDAYMKLKKMSPLPPLNPYTALPIDYSKLTKGQLETVLHSTSAEVVRLKSMEKMIREHISRKRK
ncbi:MAG: hypothetical protein OQJ97_18440 [Rhodospirillales bacterium]|nr:hypothetical protein [Rhodospirillales bacterium]